MNPVVRVLSGVRDVCPCTQVAYTIVNTASAEMYRLLVRALVSPAVSIGAPMIGPPLSSHSCDVDIAVLNDELCAYTLFLNRQIHPSTLITQRLFVMGPIVVGIAPVSVVCHNSRESLIGMLVSHEHTI